jgi:nitroreductase
MHDILARTGAAADTPPAGDWRKPQRIRSAASPGARARASLQEVELREAMTTAWTNRQFKPDDVSDAVIHDVLEAARFAPSGGNRQGWRVIVVKDADRRRALRDLYLEAWNPYIATVKADANATKLQSRSVQAADDFAQTLHEIPVLLVVCVDLTTLAVTDAALDRQSIVGGASIYPFVQNVLLASRDAGLGASLTTILVAAEPRVAELLGIPEGFAVAALVALGWPVKVPTKLSRRPVEEFAFRERFGDH